LWPTVLAKARVALAGAVGPFVLMLASVVLLQGANGAFRNDFGGHSDEPAHFVTGLMMRDYLGSFAWSDPLRYAKDYYSHYPKVALGHWPPLFYLIQSIWTLVLPPTRASLLVLMALITASLAVSLRGVLRAELTSCPWLGTLAGLVLIFLPLIQQSSGLVMSDILAALFCFLAAMRFGVYLDSGRLRDATAFGLYASLAAMTKGNGLALAFLPPLAILIDRRFDLLRRPSFWWPGVLVLLLCGPWYWLTREMAANGMKNGGHPTLGFTTAAIGFQSSSLVSSIGVGLTALAAVGLGTRLRGQHGGRWTAAAALIAGMALFQSAIPAGLEARYLIPILPPALMFVASGIIWTAGRLPLRRIATVSGIAVVGLAAALIFVGEVFTLKPVACRGYSNAAVKLLSMPGRRDLPCLISSDPAGEGAFIAEVALRDGSRPYHKVMRSSNVLCSSDWIGGSYKLKAATSREILETIERNHVGIVVVDETTPRISWLEHHFKLVEAIEAEPLRWVCLGSCDLIRRGRITPRAIKIYKYNRANRLPGGTLPPSVPPEPAALPARSPNTFSS